MIKEEGLKEDRQGSSFIIFYLSAYARQRQCVVSACVFNCFFMCRRIGEYNGFAISVCRLRERGRMSKSVCACVSRFRITEICYSLVDRTTALISRLD